MKFAELKKIASEKWERITNPSKVLIFIGMGTCGKSSGADLTEAYLSERCREKKIDCEIIRVGCNGVCYLEPLVDVLKPAHPRICFGNVTSKNAEKIVDEYILNDKIPQDIAIGYISPDGKNSQPLRAEHLDIPNFFEMPFMKHQTRRVLKRCGFIDPEDIHHYIACGGYSGLKKALMMSSAEIIEEIKKSGLRGRGGAGFPTWQKWHACQEASSEFIVQSSEQKQLRTTNTACPRMSLSGELRTKYVICNADEGDPGAFMNRALLESDPHSVLEGMLIAGYAIGAKIGYIYCRAEYPLAIKRLNIAIGQMREFNLLGKNILGSDFDFDIHIKEGAGAFVCGEETALISSIEGKRGNPRPRPPFPAEKGLFGCPTVINNVETFACVSLILQNGASWFAEVGTEKSKGTKTFCLVGKIRKTGLIEVPLGTKLKQVIYEIGDGIANDKKFKAIQIGGPSGGCLPGSLLDLPIDYESLTSAGTIMGSGGMIVIDENNCAVDLAKYFLDFTQKESCGKCTPCRTGTKQMLNILEKITGGFAEQSDLTKLQQLAYAIEATALCGLGKTAPNPVLTTLKYFYDEYKSHIEDKKCPAAICKALISYDILPDKCNGCHLCFKSCPAEAIKGEPKKVHSIDHKKCTKCGVCLDVCKFNAVEIINHGEHRE